MTRQELDYHWELLQQLWENRELLATMEAKAAPRPRRLDGMPRVSGIGDPVGDLVTEIADLKERINDLETEIASSEVAVEAFIKTIADDRTRIIFRLRFLRGLAWGEVADILGRRTTSDAVKSACYRYLASSNMSRIKERR